jgi:hypothetical protein
MMSKRIWKRLLIGAAALCLVGGSVPSAHAASCGDANNNGVVDPGDGALLLQFVGGLISGTNLCGGLGVNQCLDENADGAVNTGDLVILLNVIAGNPVVFQCSNPPPAIPCGTNLRNSIPNNITIPTGCDTFVDGTVFVQPNVVVSIQPGAVVKGRKTSFNTTPSVLVFPRTAKINGPGTAALPIVFTSDQAPGNRLKGDWGGLVFNGRAPVNCPGGECLAEGLTGIAFGGNVANDTSGLLTYARIEFSGVELSPDNELNLLTMNAVGRSTTFNHLQANHGFDDDFEWFGGTVNMKYLVASSCGDDCFDWQLGYTGSVQYGLAVVNRNNTDTNGRHAFEADNNENGFGFLPRSNPKFCNMTLVGTKAQGDSGAGRRGVLFRRGTAGKVWNTIIDGFTEAGVRVDNPETAAQACTSSSALRADSPGNPNLELRNVILFDNGPGPLAQITNGAAGFVCTAQQWLTLLNASNNVQPALVTDTGPDPLIGEAPYPTTNTAQYVPTAGGPADGNAGTNCQPLDPSWMDAKQYLGAFQPGNTTPGDAGNWLDPTSSWVNFNTN